MSYGGYPDLSGVKKILVIKLRHLGDVLLTTPLFSLLKKKFPQAEIDAYIYKSTSPILEGHPAISEIITWDEKVKEFGFLKKIFKEIKLIRFFRQKKYDLVINLTEGDRGALVAFFSGAKFRVGYDNGRGIKGKRKIYTHLVKLSSSPRHVVEKNLDFLRRIGLFPTAEDKSLFFHLPKLAYEKMKNLLKENKLNSKDYILIHPASRWRFKCWPTFKIISLSKELLKRGEKLLFTSGEEEFEKKMIAEITEALPKDKVLNLGGQISLKELGCLIDMSKMVLCVDSLPLHLASAFKARCVVLFGPTEERNWGPWENEKAKVVVEDFNCRPCGMDGCGGSKVSDCLSSISETKVLSAIDELFKTVN
jgi:heptosyltransferase III